MDRHAGVADERFSLLSMALNALERSRANERLLTSYKCPCTICKGGGRPVLRFTIETHLRRHGRDPTLKHCMLAEDSNLLDFNINDVGDGSPTAVDNDFEGPQATFDEGVDFHRMATEWFLDVDTRREAMTVDSENEEDSNVDGGGGGLHNEEPSMEEWLRSSQAPLYAGSKISALACVLVLMNLAHIHNVSNSFMDELFSFLRLDMLPTSNGLPKNRYEARRLIDRLGLKFNTIHSCQNGCILYRKDWASLSECPKCESPRYVDGSCTVPVKVLRHFPLIPRLLRMYRCRDIASLLRWSENNVSTDGKMRSTLDSPAWKEVKEIDPTFFNEKKNVKLGLALDGMNPFADKSTRHSTWPIFLLNYNLPGWMVTKRFFVMLSLLIPGKESVRSENIDVYLEPLVDELLLLWDGVPAVDMSESPKATKFRLRGMLLWTIHDYPAYGLISGCVTKGYQGCPICGPNVDSRFSKSLRKNIFQGHRRYLPENHPFRFMTESFNGKEEHCSKPVRVTGSEHRRRGEARERWLHAGGTAGSENDPVKRHGVKRHSVLFKLPYWEKLLIRHVLDVMHCEKNIAENLLNTLLGFKDGPSVRNDMKEANCKRSLHIQKARPPLTGFSMPKAPYVLSLENKRILIRRLRDLKTPTAYMSNLKSKVEADGSIHGLKSHDYHVLLQQILPVCLRGLLPDRVMKVVLQLSLVFQKICLKILDPMQIIKLQEEVAIAICSLERLFPPSFFDPMSHLPVHLVEELQICGPVHNRWMYPLERYMKYMKTYVRNKARPEGCMATGTNMEVGLGLSTEYILECESTRRRVWDAEEESGENDEVTAFAYRYRNLTAEECQWAHSCVLNNSSCLDELRETHKRMVTEVVESRASYRRGVHPRQRRRLEYPVEMNIVPKFSEWLRNVVQAGNQVFEEDVVDLSMLPTSRTRSFKSMKAYENHFRVSSAETNLVTTDSGVTVTCETLQRSSVGDTHAIVGEVTYYGKVEEILELDYGRLKPILLLCDWVPPISRGPTTCVKTDKYGFTLIKLNRRMRPSANSFVFPLQATQVFYINCEEEPEWAAVVKTDPRSTRVFQESDLNTTSNVFDGYDGLFVEDNSVDEEVNLNNIDGTQENFSDHITEEELRAFDLRVGLAGEEVHEEESEDDSVLLVGVDAHS